ncbi:Uncharacterised protein [uncultured archaeon]|nr:Uncharacterised protein [uncultured archaeon]
MGVIRGFFLVIVSILLFFSLFFSIILMSFSSSLNYNNVQIEATGIIKEVISQNASLTSFADDAYPFIQIYCKNNSNYIIRTGGYNLTISCTYALQGKDAIIDEAIKGLIHEVYYRQYDCDFIHCFKQNELPLFVISEKSHIFWENAFYISVLACLILLAGAFFLIKNKRNFLILTGVLMTLISLPFFKINSLISFISDKTIFKIVSVFFSGTKTASLLFLILGIALIIFGIVLRIIEKKQKTINQKDVKKSTKRKSK